MPRPEGWYPGTLLLVFHHLFCCMLTGIAVHRQCEPCFFREEGAPQSAGRVASGCTTDSHHLYKVFMGRLLQCIFQWDRRDIFLLKDAKRQDLLSLGVEHPSEEALINRISRCDLARHCQHATHPPQNIAMLVQQLLEAYDGNQVRDTLGVPLLNSEHAWDEWEKANVHVACLQDPPGMQLYTELGTMRMVGVELKTYRCARGSTSLESFHLHLTCFIPGIASVIALFTFDCSMAGYDKVHKLSTYLVSV
ncbi:uncharacterized protein LOC112560588 [Pomacea canaliculata]|uniref:uncharacterized protein LOC112560588 n=1 Tax=Pomacea canaliculata TaxID=400727 RepID=UPI000D737C2C|nr:uncharacterized protein LOC112560588 [Pomacea canaliculata]XP_025088306.1 uncharacterized protein LOC112560588 [Pomacea canaliculata]